MKFPKTSLVRNISTVGASTLLTQAALLVVMPLLTRLYSTDAFGMFATFSALHAAALIIFSFKYDVAIIVPSDDGDARNALALSILLPTCLSTMLLILLVGYAVWVGGIGWNLFLLSLSVPCASIYSTFQQWGARHRDYRQYSISQIVNSAFNIVLSVIIGLMLSGLREGLVLGFVVGLVASAAYMSWVLRSMWDAERFGRRLPALSSLLSTARKYRHMPMQVLPFTILTVIIHSAAPLVLNTSYRLSDIGLYAVASRALLAPSSIVAAAVGEPFRAELAARTRNGDELLSLTRKILLFLVSFSAATFMTIYVVAPFLFEWLFGVGFARSGTIAQALCLGAFAQFIILPMNQVFVITGRMREGLIAQGLVALIPTLTLLVASDSRSMEEALFAWSVAMLVTGATLVFMVDRSAMHARETPATNKQ